MTLLILDIDDLKKYISVSKGNMYIDWEPYIRQATEIYLLPTLGAELYDVLLNPQTADELELLEMVKRALAYLSFYKYIPFIQVHISQAGISIYSTDTQKTAFQWQVDDVKKNVVSIGFNQIDVYLIFLEEKVDDFPEWESSPAFIIYRQFFVKNADEFNKWQNIRRSRYTFINMEAIMRNVELGYIKPAISPEYFDELKAEDEIDALTPDNKIIVDMLKPAIVHRVVNQSVGKIPLNIQASSISIIEEVSNSTNFKTQKLAPDNYMNGLKEDSKASASAYLQETLDFLNKEASDSRYQTYFTYGKPDENNYVFTQNKNSKIFGAF